MIAITLAIRRQSIIARSTTEVSIDGLHIPRKLFKHLINMS